ncbi:MAG: nitronate monooxygenase [Gammaproteobacteria bacterium]|nr:MAG: nitronate monooxygenase [Gammaproteobacteria bacterium]
MAIKTGLTECLGIEHPVISAPMALVAGGRLAAAVSEAGGLGLIGGGYGDADWLRRELGAAQHARIGVGFITWSLAQQPRLLDVALAHSPAALMLSFGDARPFVPKIQSAGVLLICQVQTVAQAREAVALGADIVVAQGSEAGGHGAARATFPLVPAVVDAVGEIPVVAAGGIADGRGLAAALMLGASGVLVGTRFYASAESAAHAGAKQMLIASSGDDTLRSSVFDRVRGIDWPRPYDLRSLRNAYLEHWHGRESELAQNLKAEQASYEAARQAGDFDIAPVIAGEVADLVRELAPAASIVERMVIQAQQLLRQAEGLVCGRAILK